MVSKHIHYWLETGIPHPLVPVVWRFKYVCSVCTKTKYFKPHPVNPLVPSALEVYKSEVAKGNAHLVMSPPLLNIEDQFVEGLRYKKLIAPQEVEN